MSSVIDATIVFLGVAAIVMAAITAIETTSVSDDEAVDKPAVKSSPLAKAA